MSELDIPVQTSEDESWPEKLLEEYGRLSLPSLYDFILSQEKLSAEIRRQNKELRLLNQECKQIQEKLLTIEQQLATPLLPEEPCEELKEEFPVNPQILMDAMDILWTLFQGQQAVSETLLSIIFRKRKWWSFGKPSWCVHLEHIIEGYVEGFEASQQKLILLLSAVNITVILPELESSFQPHLHKIVQTLEGGKKGIIAKVIRCGYLKNGEVLRYAEVSII